MNTFFSRRQFFALAATLLIGTLLCAGCSRAGDNVAAARGGGGDLAGRKIKVTATIGMIADAVKNVGGERVQVTGLMGPGVDPHLYKPTPGDVQALNEADIIFYGGLELEGRMTDIFVKVARTGKTTIAVSEKIEKNQLREPPEFHGKFDPHIWFDVILWKRAVETIRDTLTERDPNHRAVYEKNAAAYLDKLDDLSAYVQTAIGKIPKEQRVLITAHDAFGYFGDRYGMEVRGLQGTSTAAEAGVGDVQNLSQFIADRKIKAIFVESSVPKTTIEAVQKAVEARGFAVSIGGQLYSDAMGPEGTAAGTYIGMVRHNVDTIVEALT